MWLQTLSPATKPSIEFIFSILQFITGIALLYYLKFISLKFRYINETKKISRTELFNVGDIKSGIKKRIISIFILALFILIIFLVNSDIF